RTAVRYATGTWPTAIVVRDFNGDGKPDLAVTNGISRDVSVLLGSGDGTFQAGVRYPSGQGASAGAFGITAGDFNADGKLDVAVGYRGNPSVVMLRLGNGDGTFTNGGTFAVGRAPFFMIAGDWNGDGKADLAVSSEFDSSVSVLLGNGDGTFQPSIDYGYNSFAESVVAADLDGDGSVDLAVANATGASVSILFGKGDGSFHSSRTVSV